MTVNLQIIETQHILTVNQRVSAAEGQPSVCFDRGKIDSALHSTFYPGSYPFAHGGIARIGGAMCFYICKNHAFQDGNKRTAMQAALLFLALNSVSLKYPNDPSKNQSDLADLILSCASGGKSIEEMKNWFDLHKI